MTSTTALSLSGERFTAIYQLRCPAHELDARVRDLCIEQTVEFPEDLITDPLIRDGIIGQMLGQQSLDDDRFEIRISYPVEVAGHELTQLINVLFGNISLKPGVRLQDLELSETLSRRYRGPRFGCSGLRECLGVFDRPLLCTALKPMGLSASALADLAYRMALGGIDLIKDDHGLADQAFCRFQDRVSACAAAVERANRETGGNTRYFPNITASADAIVKRARFARDVGAGGLLCCPGLTGFDAMRQLAEDHRLGLPIMAHPAFLGSFCTDSDSGIGHRMLYGVLNRLAGADATIFPHYGGRFSFTETECRELVAGTAQPLGALRPILPVPAGGMRLDRVAELRRFYGVDFVLLIGGDLHRSEDLVANCARFVALAGAQA